MLNYPITKKLHHITKVQSMSKDKIAIIDFGSQYTQLIGRRVRELGVYSEIFPYTVDEQTIRDFDPKCTILSGGNQSVTEDDTPRIPQVIFDINRPTLGICYGMQSLAEQLGGKVQGSIGKREFGLAKVHITSESKLFKNVGGIKKPSFIEFFFSMMLSIILLSVFFSRFFSTNSAGILSLFLSPFLAAVSLILLRKFKKVDRTIDVWMSHGDSVVKLPPGFKNIAKSDNTLIAAMENPTNKYYAIQFHAEVVHTPQGQTILSNFIHDIAGCKSTWTTKNIQDDMIKKIRDQVGDERVILGLSGGVDSSVLLMLLHKAIGKQVIPVHVNTGLMRLNESDMVTSMFKDIGVDIVVVDAQDRFFEALAGISEPEAKRKIIGKLFVEIFEEEKQRLKQEFSVKFLAQGTIYPDVIESAKTKTCGGHVIKSHHNVGGLPENMKFELVEPLRELFKDEVRKLGLALGLPEKMVNRHPFPGVGLGVRILGEVKKEYADILRAADDVFMQVLKKYDYYNKVNQAFAVFIPSKSVGVKGDGRNYEPVIALRAVETIDFMTANSARLPYELLEEATLRIINEVSGISRVVFDITGKPPGTIEWE